MNRENVLERKMYDYSKTIEIMQIILICIGALIVPTFLARLLTIIFGQNSYIVANSQIIVGTIVNISLIITAINVKGWKRIIGIITLPSISSILGGYVFKTASVYMVYMIPFIWLGNFSIIYLYKLLLLNKNYNYFLTGAISIFIKVSIIFLGFNILNSFGIFPDKLIKNLQNAMGVMQVITAITAMFITYIVYRGNKKKIRSSL